MWNYLTVSALDSNLDLACNCCFARLMDCISSLLDIIFRVPLILFQSSRLRTTDLGLPSGVVMNSIFGNSSAFDMIKLPLFAYLYLGLTKKNNLTFSHLIFGLSSAAPQLQNSLGESSLRQNNQLFLRFCSIGPTKSNHKSESEECQLIFSRALSLCGKHYY